MSLFMTTGFDHDVYANRFGIAGTIAAPGRFGRGRYARFSNGNHYANLALRPGEEYHSWIIGFACRETTGPYVNLAYSSAFIRLFGDGGQSHVDIYWTSPASGQYVVRARNGGSGAVLQDSAPISLVEGVWHYYEFKVTVDDVAGSVEVRRDGVSIINVAGVDTRNAGTTANVHTIRFGQNGNNNVGSLDDIYVLKQDGVGAVNFLGEVEVEALRPNGNGTYSELTGSDLDTTDNYLHVDDGPGVSDADFVASSVDGQKDTYTFTDMVRANPVVRGVQLSARVRKNDTDPKSVRTVLRTDGVDYPGSDFLLPSSFIWNQELYETHPGTGVLWTPAQVNDLEAGVEVRP